MDHEIIRQVRGWLDQGVVELFLGYRITDGHPLPHVFTRDQIVEVNEMVPGSARYPLEKIAWQMARLYPDATIGLLAQDGEQRALNVLELYNQIEEGRIKVLRVSGPPPELKEQVDWSFLKPKVTGIVKQALGIEFNAEPGDIERLDPWERFSRWMYEFQKCIKCYGCRNICPVCFCNECSLENADLVGTGRLPPEVPVFHLVRAVHMAGRCFDCGLCEEACPAEIPLRVLYRKVNEIVKEVFGYETGTSFNPSPLNVLGKEVTLEPKPI
jgi:formate dehydrogenase subunit beta